MDTLLATRFGDTDRESSLVSSFLDVEPPPEAIAYVGAPQFHQVIRCPRTNMRVAFSEGGPRDGIPVLYSLPAVCTRYCGGPYYDGRARMYGIRLIAIDRPGMGGTDKCALKDRLEVSAQHVLSVLDYLSIKKVTIFAHSIGVVYTLHLLVKYPEIFDTNPRVYLSSPWVPTKISGRKIVQVVPSALLDNAEHLMPSLRSLAVSTGRYVTFSSNLLARKRDKTSYTVPERLRPPEGQQYKPQPPFHMTAQPSRRILRLIQRCVMSEPLQGNSQDFMLGLSRKGASGVTPDWYRATIALIAEQFDKSGQKLYIEAWWGAEDWLIPAKGRRWLDALLGSYEDSITYVPFEVEGAGHDTHLQYDEIMCGMFEDIQAHCE